MLILVAVLLAAVAVPVAALARGFGKSSVKASFSGGANGSHKLYGLDRCKVLNGGNSKQVNINLRLGSGKPLSISFEKPSVEVAMVVTGQAINNASLNTPGSLAVLAVGNRQWKWPNTSAGGSGTVSLSASRRSGSVNAELTPLAGTGAHGKVHLTASWHCAKASSV